VFRYPNVRFNITAFNGMNFNWLIGFGFSSSCNTSYYVIDHGASRVYILNDDCSIVSYKNFAYPAYMITIGSSIYMTGNTYIWKLYKDLNILIQYNSTGSTSPNFRGIYYNSSNGFIYVAPVNLKEIQVFDLNLIFNHNISISSCKPFSISEYNNKMFVGTSNGTILVIQNEMIINQFNGCNMITIKLNFILFDQYGYMATICSDPTNKLYFYDTDGTYTGTFLSTPVNPRYIGFDTKGRFVVISFNQISIYN
jgi:hypothetical protein